MKHHEKISEINSVQNPAIKHVAKLHSAKYRNQFRQCTAEGIRICSALIQSKKIELQHIYVTKKQLDTAQSLSTTVPITVVSDTVMDKISSSTTASGIVCLFAIPQNMSLTNAHTPALVLVDMSDPGNMGTLIRTAAALNISTIVVIGGVDVWNPKVVQASAGAIGMVNIIETTWSTLVTHAKKNKQILYGLVVEDGQSPHHLKSNNAFIVVGGEAHGLTAQQQADCNQLITLPMPGGTESLNAAVAGSIASYLLCQKIGK